MKHTDHQIQEALNEAYKKAGHNAYFAQGFSAGIEFADIQNEISSQNLLKSLESMIDAFGHYDLELTDEQGMKAIKEAKWAVQKATP